MGYIIAFVLIVGGYTLADWGHYMVQSKHISMWYLITGKTK